jgi:hypothetical protein
MNRLRRTRLKYLPNEPNEQLKTAKQTQSARQPGALADPAVMPDKPNWNANYRI